MHPRSVIALLLLCGVSFAQAEVKISSNWFKIFGEDSSFEREMIEATLTDPETAQSITMKVSVVDGVNLAVEYQLGIGDRSSPQIQEGESLQFVWDKPITDLSIQPLNIADDSEWSVASEAFETIFCKGGRLVKIAASIPANTPVVVLGGDGSRGGSPAEFRIRGVSFNIAEQKE